MPNIEVSPFQLVAGAIVAVCIVAIMIIAIRQYLRTKTWPRELTHIEDRPIRSVPLYAIILTDILLRTVLPKSIMTTIPAALVFSAFDLSLFVAFASICALAISCSFRGSWNRQVALKQTYFIVFAAVLGTFIVLDVVVYQFALWTWIVAGLAACFLIPIFTRLAYVEYYERYMQPVD